MISVVIPCYNEEDGIAQLEATLKRLEAMVEAEGEGLEVILVDDGSRDATLARLRETFDGRGGYHILPHGTNRGVGAAMRTGFEAATGAVVACYDADCAYPVEDILTLVKAVKGGADVASATPFLEGGGFEQIPWHRQALSWGLAGLYRLVLGQPAASVRNFSCAFRAYRREVLRNLPFQSDRFPAASELLARALLQGYRVAWVPSVLSERRFGVSKMKKGETIKAHLKLLAQFALLRMEK